MPSNITITHTQRKRERERREGERDAEGVTERERLIREIHAGVREREGDSRRRLL